MGQIQGKTVLLWVGREFELSGLIGSVKGQRTKDIFRRPHFQCSNYTLYTTHGQLLDTFAFLYFCCSKHQRSAEWMLKLLWGRNKSTQLYRSKHMRSQSGTQTLLSSYVTWLSRNLEQLSLLSVSFHRFLLFWVWCALLNLLVEGCAIAWRQARKIYVTLGHEMKLFAWHELMYVFYLPADLQNTRSTRLVREMSCRMEGKFLL